ncbi:unnamed protein product [Rhizophagus irregularis]|nr:unnamed protein product [Rhizophagus irregularis]
MQKKFSGKTPGWFAALEQLVLDSPNLSRRLKSEWSLSATKQFALPMPTVDISRDKKFEWVVVWDQYAKHAIFGHIVNKYAQTNSIIVQHYMHFIDGDVISPSYQKPIGTACQGCSINNPCFNDIWIDKCRLTQCHYTCTSKYLVGMAIVIDRAKFDKHWNIVNDLVEPVQPPSTGSLPDEPADSVLSYVSSMDTRLVLQRFKMAFKDAVNLTFYTDGSVKYSAVSDQFPSANKSEALAVLSALCVAPVYCNVTFYTDSLYVIYMMQHFVNNYCNNWRIVSHEQGIAIWAAIRKLVRVNNLNVTMEKVVAHSNNVWNDQVDTLAKDINVVDEFAVNYDYGDIGFLSWDTTVLDFSF